MCGIIGQINLNRDKLIDEKTLIEMRDTLTHRGPDQGGAFIDKNVGLAFRRLSIIDLSADGAQPMSNEDGSVWLVYNGEFYNYLDYRQELINKGHIFKSKTDSEVIIHLYEEYGLEFVKKINGMFAVAIYDKNKELIILARDRFGVKPLAYYLDEEKLIFASEIKAILENSGVKKDINLDSLVEYFSFGYVLSPDSIFKSIKKINPSEISVFSIKDKKFISREIYWQLKFEINKNLSFSAWQEKFENALFNATEKRLMSDVPLGIFLSGGLDSSSIVALLASHTGQRFKTFSIGFKEPKYSETEYSRFVSKKFNTEHFEYIVDENIDDVLTKLAWFYDEPFNDPSALPTYFLSKFTREHVTVALSGDGGDELLAGYPRYQAVEKLNRYFNFFPESFKKSIFSTIFKFYPEKLRGQRTFYHLSLSPEKAYLEFVKTFNEADVLKLFSSDVSTGFLRNKFNNLISAESDRGSLDVITKMQNIDRKSYLPGDILTKVDIASMANSLEVRSPFLDYKLWELVFSMPVDTRYKDRVGKYIFKETLKKYFPEDFIYRKKMGFSPPLDYWFKGSYKKTARNILLGDKFLSRGFFSREYIKKILDIHDYGKRDLSRKIWTLLFFDRWCQNWLD